MSQSSNFDAYAICSTIGAWPLRKFFKISSKVTFLERSFNDEKNDTLVGSLIAILPDLNVSSIHVCIYPSDKDCSRTGWSDMTKRGKDFSVVLAKSQVNAGIVSLMRFAGRFVRSRRRRPDLFFHSFYLTIGEQTNWLWRRQWDSFFPRRRWVIPRDGRGVGTILLMGRRSNN